MTQISAAVGLRNLTGKVPSRRVDQDKVLGLLARIGSASGGKREAWSGAGRPVSEEDGSCPVPLAAAIADFQRFWIRKGELKVADAVVDPDGSTLRRLDAAAGAAPAPPNGQPAADPGEMVFDGDIKLIQRNTPELVAVHSVSNPVIQPLSLLLPRLVQFELKSRIRELRFEVVKPHGRFWVGVAVPEGTADFTRPHLFFHPTPVQAGKVVAADSDYPKFTGGWSKFIQRYMPRHGGQMAAARKLPLIIPYMTMAAAKMEEARNVFADRPVATINAILAATERIVTGSKTAAPQLAVMSTSSFSSGITYLASFLEKMERNGRVTEVMDFDSSFIVSPHPKVTGVPGGGNFLQFTQFSGRVPVPGRFDLPPPRWVDTHMKDSHGKPLGVHGKIGWMMFFTAMLSSVLVTT